MGPLPEKWKVIAVQDGQGQWVLQPFAPVTLREVATLRERGLVDTVQRRGDAGAMELMVKGTRKG